MSNFVDGIDIISIPGCIPDNLLKLNSLVTALFQVASLIDEISLTPSDYGKLSQELKQKTGVTLHMLSQCSDVCAKFSQRNWDKYWEMSRKYGN